MGEIFQKIYGVMFLSLPNIGIRQATYNVPVRQDYHELVEKFAYPSEIKKEIQKLFDEEVYPHFEK